MDHQDMQSKTKPETALSERASRRILRELGLLPSASGAPVVRDSSEQELLEGFERAWPNLQARLQSAALQPSGEPVESLRRAAQWHLDRFLGCDLRKLVVEPMEAHGWNGVAVYTPDPAQTALRVVAASDHTAVSTLSHSLHRHEGVISDIEVDTFQRRRAERFQGGVFDPRFDPYLYRVGEHSRFQDRLFVPLVLVRSEADCRICQEFCLWVRRGNEWEPTVPPGYQLQAIGTMSVHRQEAGSLELMSKTLHLATQIAPAVHAASLPGLLEALLGELMRVAGAKHGAIHAGPDAESVFMGEQAVVLRHGRGVSLGCHEAGGVASPPRRRGIGALALEARRAISVSVPELTARNQRLADMGVNTTIAAPMLNGSDDVIGLTYLHYDSKPNVQDAQPFVDVVAFAVGVALRCTERLMAPERLLTEAAVIAQSAEGSLKDRVERMTHLIWTLLGCDFASCVMVSPDDDKRTVYHLGRFVGDTTPLAPGGKLLQEVLRSLPLPSQATYFEGNVRVWPPVRAEFMRNEGIVSSALVPIRDGDRSRGFLMVDYRRPHNFKRGFRGRESQLLEALGALLGTGLSRDSTAQRNRSAARLVATAQRGIASRVEAESSARCRAHVGITHQS